jgi:hypothetical protein
MAPSMSSVDFAEQFVVRAKRGTLHVPMCTVSARLHYDGVSKGFLKLLNAVREVDDGVLGRALTGLGLCYVSHVSPQVCDEIAGCDAGGSCASGAWSIGPRPSSALTSSLVTMPSLNSAMLMSAMVCVIAARKVTRVKRDTELSTKPDRRQQVGVATKRLLETTHPPTKAEAHEMLELHFSGRVVKCLLAGACLKH